MVVALCACGSSAVKQGRKAYGQWLSCLHYEYVADKGMIVSETGGRVEFSVITRVREKGGEPYKPKAFRFVCENGKVVSGRRVIFPKFQREHNKDRRAV